MSIKALYLRPHISPRPIIIKFNVSVPIDNILIGKLNSMIHKNVILTIYLNKEYLYQVSHYKGVFQRSHVVEIR